MSLSTAPTTSSTAQQLARKRRLSQPNPSLQHHEASPSASLLGFPTVSGLRAALLGYLGEAENAIRERLGMDPVDGDDESFSSGSGSGYGYGDADGYRRSSITSSRSPASEDELDCGEAAGTGTARGTDAPTGELRCRRPHNNTRAQTSSNSNGLPHLRGPNSPPPNAEDHAVLDSLRNLREDIVAYVPAVPAGLSGLAPNREWLRSLPHRLRDVDLGLEPALGGVSTSPPADGRVPAGVAWPDPVSASSRAMNSARQHVIDYVHSALPPDDWAGWETLGWGDQDRALRRTRSHHAKSCSLDDRWAPVDEEDGGDEPEYLFPNRTPGPASAIARRRLKRSKSVGDSDFAGLLPPSFLNPWIRPDLAATVADDEGEADLANLDAQTVEAALAAAEEDLHAHEVEVACEKHGAHQLLDDVAVIPTIAESLERSSHGQKLIAFTDLPLSWRNNQYIHTGYRFIPLGGVHGPIPLIKSAFSLHNETVNIHSHSIPTLFIACVVPFIVWRSPLPDPHWIDTAMLISYLLAASSCLSSSAGWHILSGCANRRWFEWGACVDYIGISWLIALSFNTVVYNAYYCRPKTVALFTSINVAFGALGSYLPFQKWFNQRKNKHWRILFFLCLNVAMFAPLFSLFYEYGFTKGQQFVAPFMSSVATYIVALLFYAFHFPECSFPGRFDLVGASHNLWHLGIVCAIVLHYRGIFTAYDMRWDYSCAAPGAGTPFPHAVMQMLLG